MLCDKCITMLANTCSHEAKMIFNAIVEQGKMSRTEIQHETGLTYAIASRSIDELENKLLITHQVKGRAKQYWLTKMGARLVMLSQKGDSQKLRNNKGAKVK